jgi:hypothetical protein
LIPVVVDDAGERFHKVKDAVQLLKQVGAVPVWLWRTSSRLRGFVAADAL